MKLSKYNHLFESPKYGYLIFNAETNSFAKLDSETFNILKSIEKDENNIDKLEPDTKAELLKANILVEDPELFKYKKRFRYYYNAFDSANLGLAIAPTTHCNFNCNYCFEIEKKPKYMDRTVEDNLIRFIEEHDRIKNLLVMWYGGEPLMNFESIKRLLKRFKQMKNVNLQDHSMTTNGYLLDEEKSLFFKEFPLDAIQITIDGSKEHHDARRVLASDNGPTFDRIIKNIDTFVLHNPKTKVIIRTNLDESNKDSFHVINKELNARWKDKGKNVTVVPAFVKDYSSVVNDFSETEIPEISGCRDIVCVGREHKIDFFEDLYKKHGVDIEFAPEHCIGGCGATIVNYYVVGPLGELYKCWNDIGNKEMIVGHIHSKEIENYELLTKYLAGPTMMDTEECTDCNLFPICDGACLWERHKNIYNGAKLDLCSSRKDNMDRALEIYYEQLMEKKEHVLNT